MFVKILFVTFSRASDLLDNPDIFAEIEENFLALGRNLVYDFSSDMIFVYNENFIGNDAISFADYLEEGKILKNFLIKNGLATEENYKNFFSLKKEKLQSTENVEKTPDELDAMIAKVDKNDPKLLEVLAQIQKIKK